jgi:UDP-N-acetylmuramyl pentapeptide phosphotransferase/UDP-N-acetylglucosamine-1-phosphate transferase
MGADGLAVMPVVIVAVAVSYVASVRLAPRPAPSSPSPADGAAVPTPRAPVPTPDRK